MEVTVRYSMVIWTTAYIQEGSVTLTPKYLHCCVMRRVPTRCTLPLKLSPIDPHVACFRATQPTVNAEVVIPCYFFISWNNEHIVE